MSWERQWRRSTSHSSSWTRRTKMLRKSLRSSKTRRCYPFLTEAQAKERRKGRNTESVLDNIRVIASIYNRSSVHIPFQITPTALSPFSFSFLSFVSLRTETLTNSHSHNPTALSSFSYSLSTNKISTLVHHTLYT